jgi:hypothetical protein
MNFTNTDCVENDWGGVRCGTKWITKCGEAKWQVEEQVIGQVIGQVYVQVYVQVHGLGYYQITPIKYKISQEINK